MATKMDPGDSSSQDAALLPPELHALMRKLQQAYPRVEPSPQFRQALSLRLTGEAQRLKLHQAERTHLPLLRQAVVGAAALSVAGVALLLWRGRALLPHGPLRAAQGG